MSDKDNITKLRLPNMTRKRIIWLCVVGVLVLTILAGFLFADQLNLDAVGRWFRYGSAKKQEGYGHSTFDSHSSNRYALWEDGLVVASVGGMELFVEDGSTKSRQTVSMANPVLMTGKKATLCFDAGGKDLAVWKDGMEALWTKTAEGGFFDADISSKDFMCSASSEGGYRTILRVYNEKQEEVYRWFSATRYMPVCAISENGKYLASVGLGQENGSFLSTLYLFKTDHAKKNDNEPDKSIPLDGQMVYDLKFTNKNTMCIIAEDSVKWYDLSGECLGNFDLSSSYLEEYDLGGDGFTVLSVNKYKAGDQCSVITLDEKGNKLGERFVGEEILDISANGKYVAILTQGKLEICRKDLSTYVTAPNSWMAGSVLVRKDATAYLLTGNSADLYIP